jgi:hypothetical protein
MRIPSVFATALVVLLGASRDTSATPITWTYAGFTHGVGLEGIPAGTPVQVRWTFEPDQLNECASTNWGFFRNQDVQVDIGPYSYVANDGVLFENTRTTNGCSGATLPDMELRLASWTGPNVQGGVLASIGGPFNFPGLFWSAAPQHGAFPEQPTSLLLQGPQFLSTGPGPISVVIQANVNAVPEPSTLLMVTSGLALAYRRFRRRTH